MTPSEHRAANRQRLYKFARTIYRARTNQEMLPNRHQREICRSLEQVFAHRIKRLIINVPNLFTPAIPSASPHPTHTTSAP
jgi:hypothetical protein